MKIKTLSRIFTLAITLVLCCGMAPAVSAAQPGSTADPLPDSVLYYGRIASVSRYENGDIAALRMSSDRYGSYVMLVSEDTIWIDNGSRAASDPADLKEGEGLYVFHSPVSTRSLPPQSAALAIVRNVPQDASCAHYHKVEAAEEKDGTLRITTDNGGLFLLADQGTTFSFYEGTDPAGRSDVKAGSHIMAWYGAVALSYPGQSHADHIMVLDRELTRSDLAVLLHTAQGSPAVNYAVSFADVAPDAPYAEAVRWAASQGLISRTGSFGPEIPVTREELAVILWRRAGSPMLMGYPGLTQYDDVGEISRSAQSALAWAHQKGLIPAGGRLGPKDTATWAEAKRMMEKLSK